MKYQEQCLELAKDRRELKRDLALSREEVTRLSKIIEEQEKNNKKLERKVKKLSEVE